jgi:hypothetical protein
MPVFISRVLSLSAERVDADALALAGCLFESDFAVDQCKQSVIAAYSDVAAWLDDRPPLAHEDSASADARAIAAFDAESLALGVAAVPRAAHAFLVCHF